MYQVKSAVLFIVFNRPNETKLVFEEIEKVKPKRLYIAADGPREMHVTDLDLCKKTIDIFSKIEWECELNTLFRNENLGCKKAVSTAISWFFENETEGIILEDDCLPNSDFFQFCDKMLEQYRYDERIAHICGCNLQNGIKRNEFSYYFSNFTYVWGWASWRRVWKNYDPQIKLLEKGISNNFLNPLTNNIFYKIILKNIFRNVQRGKIDTWDYQYLFLNLYYKQLTIVPNYNMISNIGFNENATHTISDSVNANVPFEKMNFPLLNPSRISSNYNADNFTLQKIIPLTLPVLLNLIKQWVLFRFENKSILV
jgi:hypothetical protein